MRISTAITCCVGLTLAATQTTEAAGPVRVWRPLPTPQTILPTRAELRSVPTPERGRVAAYPVEVVRYGLTIHPGSRLVRGILAR